MKVLFVSESLAENVHSRGIFSFSTNLLRVLHGFGWSIYLATDSFDKLDFSPRLREHFYKDRQEGNAVALASFLHRYPHERDAEPRFGKLGRIWRRTSSRRAALRAVLLKPVSHKLREVAIDPSTMEYLTERSDFIKYLAGAAVVPGIYTAAKLLGAMGVEGRYLTVHDFDLVIMDTPVNVRVRSDKRNVVQIVHDLIPFTDPTSSPKSRNTFVSAFPWISKNYRSFMFVSEYTKRLFESRFDLKIKSVVSYPRSDIKVTQEGSRRGNYALLIVSRDYRKNIRRAIEASSLFSKGINLTIVGNYDSENYATIIKSINRSVPNRVTELGFVSETQKQQLIRDARCIMVPAISEGFGIPIAEGLLAGTPVVCSDIPLFREVAGDFGRYFDPYDPGSMAFAVNSIEELSKTDRLRMMDWAAARYDVRSDAAELRAFLEAVAGRHEVEPK